MPAESKTAPAAPTQLEGNVFECRSEQDLISALDKAFDYRGDITLELTNGSKVEGYLFNREHKARPPRAELFVKDSSKSVLVPYSDIRSVAFTGSDPASGKSWRDWVSKKESERIAEIEHLKAEAERLGHL